MNFIKVFLDVVVYRKFNSWNVGNCNRLLKKKNIKSTRDCRKAKNAEFCNGDC